MNTRIIDEITKFIFIEDTVKKSDIIFIPGGSVPELGEYAAAMYKDGYAVTVMPSGYIGINKNRFEGPKSKKEKYSKNYSTECEFLTDVLIINGVQAEHILGEDKARYTQQNAYFSRRMIDEKGIEINNAIICCKNFHARRCLMYYQFAFPDVEFYIRPVPYSKNGVEISAGNWYKTEAGVKRVLGEMERCGSQFLPEFKNILL